MRVAARILAVADSYDAMSTARPYRLGMTPSRVEQILTEGADSQWDRQVIEAFLRCRDKIKMVRERGLGDTLGYALNGALRIGGNSLHDVCLPVSATG